MKKIFTENRRHVIYGLDETEESNFMLVSQLYDLRKINQCVAVYLAGQSMKQFRRLNAVMAV